MIGEGKVEALMWEVKLGAIRERVAIGGLWNKLGQVWRRRAAAGGRRWVEEARDAKERSLQHHLCIISMFFFQMGGFSNQ